ncbi:hypothetical protein CDAR_566501 [Caerostris darwini]|uniref:MANSC domain-containing protein n=1 Tax=Caerostris darwini TaxID=1538125 RepID=A0AAV4X6N7_9ARAC|nr:hypothetical protein CDAR_566501 [Caerostris darwini]
MRRCLLQAMVWGCRANENNFSDTLKHELNSIKSLLNSNYNGSRENISRYNRQLDSEVETRFHITKNTIIRTGESRILGAKYINESILPNNHECLTWCLETPNCNAVVYEEKTLLSCYMFDCGAPSSYLCKFTPHDHFISSILKITQHSYDLHQWKNQVKHEKELADLQITDTHATSSLSIVDQNTEVVTSPTSVKPYNSTKPTSKCHHYQFQCINNSECIAIYNVCDGIPQCPDGSDESVDLKCHMKEFKDTMAKTQDPLDSPHATVTKLGSMNIRPNRPPSSPPIRVPQNEHVSQVIKKPKVPFNKADSIHTDSSKTIWPDRLPNGHPNRVPDGQPDRIPDGRPDRIPDGRPDRIPDRRPDRIPDGRPDRIPDGRPDRIPEGRPDRIPDGQLDRIPDRRLDRIPDGRLDRIPDGQLDRIPDGRPDILSDGRPNRISDGRPDRIPDVQPDRITDEQSDRIPDGQSDRIPDHQPSKNDYYHNDANDPHVQSLNRWSNDYDQYPSHSVSLDQPYNSYDGNYQRGDDQYLSNALSPEYDGVKSYANYRQEDIPYWANQDAAQDNTYPVEEFPQTAMHTLNKPNYPDKESLYTQQLTRTASQYPESKRPVIHKAMDVLPPVHQNRVSDMEEYKSRRYPMQRQPPYMAYEEAIEKQLSNYPVMKQKHYNPSQTADDSVYSNDDLIRASLVNQLPIEFDRPHHMYQYEKHAEEAPAAHTKNNNKDAKVITMDTPTSTVKPTKPPPKSIQKTVLDFKMSVTELHQASRTHSQETNSAILALVMGLTIFALLFVFLGCRIKTIKKRMSRKGRALAHDADYLVNGMYL